MDNAPCTLDHCSGAGAATCIDVELMLSPHGDLGATRQALDWVGTQLGVSFSLRQGAGAILLMDSAWHDQLSPQLIDALREERPLVTLPGGLVADPALPHRSMHGPEAALDLLQQFSALPALAEKSAGLAAVEHDAPLKWPRWLQQVLQGRDESATPALLASYGDGACMHFDFSQRKVHCDPLALQHLRLHRELPRPVSRAPLQRDAVRHRLDHTLWDLGIAAGSLPLLNAPADFWLAPVRWAAAASVRPYSRRPMHLEALRWLQSGPLSPAHLQRRLRASHTELRQFLQAGLLAGLLHWTSLATEKGHP